MAECGPFRALLRYERGEGASSLHSVPPSENAFTAKLGLERAFAGAFVSRIPTAAAVAAAPASFPQRRTLPTLSVPVDAYLVRYDSPKEVDVSVDQDAVSSLKTRALKLNASEREMSPRRSPRRSEPADLGGANTTQMRYFNTSTDPAIPAESAAAAGPSNQISEKAGGAGGAKRKAGPAQGKGKKGKVPSPLFLLVIRERSESSSNGNVSHHEYVSNLLRRNDVPAERDQTAGAGRVLSIHRIFDPVLSDDGGFDRLGLRNKLAATSQAVHLTADPTHGTLLWREESLEACGRLRAGSELGTSVCFLRCYEPAKGRPKGAATRKKKGDGSSLPTISFRSIEFVSTVELGLFSRSLRAASQISMCSHYGKMAPMITVVDDEDSSDESNDKVVPKPSGRAKKPAPVVVLVRRVEDGSNGEPAYVIVKAKEAAERKKRQRESDTEVQPESPASPPAAATASNKKSRHDSTDDEPPPAENNKTKVHAPSAADGKSEPVASSPAPKAEPAISSPTKVVDEQVAPSSRQFFFVTPDDRPIVTDYMLLLVTQVKRGAFDESDRANVYRQNSSLEDGYLGMRCRHCGGKEAGSYFPTAYKNLQGCMQTLNTHLMKCKSCPASMKRALKISKSRHKSQLAKLEVGRMGVFLAIFWKRIQDASYDGCGEAEARTMAKIAQELVSSFVPRAAGTTKPTSAKPEESPKQQGDCSGIDDQVKPESPEQDDASGADVPAKPASSKQQDDASGADDEATEMSHASLNNKPGPESDKDQDASTGSSNGEAGPTDIADGSKAPSDAFANADTKIARPSGIGGASLSTPVAASSSFPIDGATEDVKSEAKVKILSQQSVTSNASLTIGVKKKEPSVSTADASLSTREANCSSIATDSGAAGENVTVSSNEDSACLDEERDSKIGEVDRSDSSLLPPASSKIGPTVTSETNESPQPVSTITTETADMRPTSAGSSTDHEQSTSAVASNTDVPPAPEMEMDFDVILEALDAGGDQSQPRLTDTMEIDHSARPESRGKHIRGGASKIGKMRAFKFGPRGVPVASKCLPSVDNDDTSDEESLSPTNAPPTFGKVLVAPTMEECTTGTPVPVSKSTCINVVTEHQDTLEDSTLSTPTVTFLNRLFEHHHRTPFSCTSFDPTGAPMDLGSHHDDKSPVNFDPGQIFP